MIPNGPSKSGPTVVGIGASAGGLAALRNLLNHVPPDSGLAFVIVVHLSPDHESHLAQLLQPHVRFPVAQVSETTRVEPNHAYVIPPNANLNSIDTHLRLSKLEARRTERAPIDHFFATLAKTHDGNAIAVILTGTGSDGTLGIKDVKANGGLVIAQDPNEAEYDGMPQSAIATGMVDFILPLAEIPSSILRFERTQPRVPPVSDGEEVSQDDLALLHKVFAQLRARTDRDFSRYKRSTVLRRISRRMQLNYVEDLPGYLETLRERPDEVRALADDLLITVTHFFRDREVFERLQNEEIPRLFARKAPQEIIRVWSVGCATGEEAYSLAMLLTEEASRREAAPPIQVFASDLHSRSLEKAREGIYSGDIETDVSPERLKRFFQRENGGFRIRKEIRDLVVFAPHNLLADPPFSRMDIIACRNLLIYLERDVQRDAIELFHYSLNPEGALLLGSAESMDGADLFLIEDKKLCIFRKRNVPPREPRLPVFPLTRSRLPGDTAARVEHRLEQIAYGSLHQQMVEQYAPPSILVSPENRLVHLSEHAGRYLVHPGGEPTTSILMVVRDEMRIELQASLQLAREKKFQLDSKPIDVKFNGHSRPVVLHVRPALEPERDGFVLVIFEEREPRVQGVTTPASPSPSSAHTERLEELESELSVTRQRLQAIIEEYETSREEMKASNEEMQSTNEELRSTMEELETSKEELQSINEELQTVNQQNKHKVDELAQLSSDLQNLLSATDIATLFLDRDMRILRFTPKLSELFNVRVADRGRPISDLTHRLGYGELVSDAESVLNRLIPIEREVQDEAGRWYLTRVLPYRSTEDRIEGVVITFIDIDTRKRAEEQVRLVFEAAPNGMLVSDETGKMVMINSEMERLFGYTREEMMGQSVDMLVPQGLRSNHARLRQDYAAEPRTRAMAERLDLHGQRKDGVLFPAEVGLSPIDTGHGVWCLAAIVDITQRRRVEEQRIELVAKDRALASEKTLRATEAELARVVRALSVGELATSIAHEINQPLAGVVTNAEAATRWLEGGEPNVPEARNSLNLIVRDGARAGKVIRRIRDFIKKEEPALEPLNLNEVVREAVGMTESELIKRGMNLRWDLSDALPLVRGERVQLQQVIVNLMLNAVDAMRVSTGKDLLVRSEVLSGGSKVRVSVQDSGLGIAPQDIPRMFEAFYTTKTTGMGMGLSISRTIIEGQGGRIWAEPNDGPGLTVWFELPAADSSPPPDFGDLLSAPDPAI
jgi:two-component system CheB/CheR fusion protein